MSGIDLEYKQRKMNLIQRFFIGCSGAVKDIIEECPTEWTKYVGIGATVLFTGLLAFFSGGYALYTIFRNANLDTVDTGALLFAIPFGMLWGAIIFNIDRFIVSTFYKKDERNVLKRLGRDFLQAFPRIVLAAIIAIVISKPVEIKIFENRLSEQIKRNEINAKADKKNTISNNVYEIHVEEGRVIEFKSEINQRKADLVKDPPIVENLKNNDLIPANNELTRTKNTNDAKIRTNENTRSTISKDPNSYIWETDSLGIRRNTGRLTSVAIERRNALLREIQNWQKEISDKQNEVNRIQRQIDSARSAYRQKEEQRIDSMELRLGNMTSQLNNTIETAGIEVEQAFRTSEKAFSNNFVSQIEALGDLKKENSTMKTLGLFITLLFLCIELAPILTKLITRRGPYDETLECMEYEIMVDQKKKMNDKNAEINELMRTAEELATIKREVLVKTSKKEADLNLQTNGKILESIAQKQQTLALEAIDKWYKAQNAEITTKKI